MLKNPYAFSKKPLKILSQFVVFVILIDGLSLAASSEASSEISAVNGGGDPFYALSCR
jgi:hypothetical protein